MKWAVKRIFKKNPQRPIDSPPNSSSTPSIKKEEPEQRIIVYWRIKPEDENAIELSEFFDHIPSEAELMELSGPGYYTISTQAPGERPRPASRIRISGNPWLSVDHYTAKIKLSKDGKFLDTHAVFPGPFPPSQQDLEYELGGGYIKITARDKNGGFLWSKTYDCTEAPVLNEFLRKDKSVASVIYRKIDNMVLDSLSLKGSENVGSQVDASMEKLSAAVEGARKMEHLEKAMESFSEKLGPKKETKEESPFTAGYRMKMEALVELGKKNPELALKKLEEMPDTSAVITKLFLVGSELINVGLEILRDKIREAAEKQENRAS